MAADMLTGFVETISNVGIVRLDDIERIDGAAPNKNGVLLHKVHLRDGRTFDTFEAENGGLLRRPVQLIPSEPGTSIIFVDPSYTEKKKAWRTRVIAWALCLDGDVRPVTPNGVCDAISGPTWVELPDGSIEAVGAFTDPCGFTNEQAMIDYFYARAAKPSGAPS